MGRNAFETMYDRLRGKEPVNALSSQMAPWAPSLSGQPIPPDEPDPSYVPTGGPSINKLGSAIMGVVEDPRNAWIGLGPLAGMARVPRAAGGVKKFINELAEKYDLPWSGKLYRSGEVGKSPTGADFYALDSEMASNYGKGVAEHELPNVNKVYHVDTENLGPLEKLIGRKFNPDDDIAQFIEDAIPHLKKKGYEGAIIEGETGAQLSGVPLEFAHFPKAAKGVGKWWSVVDKNDPSEYSGYKDKETALRWLEYKKNKGDDVDLIEGNYTPPRIKAKPVDNQHAAEVVGELAYKYPDSSNDELMRLSRKHHKAIVTKEQVEGVMRELRAHEKIARREDNPNPDAILSRPPTPEVPAAAPTVTTMPKNTRRVFDMIDTKTGESSGQVESLMGSTTDLYDGRIVKFHNGEEYVYKEIFPENTINVAPKGKK